MIRLRAPFMLLVIGLFAGMEQAQAQCSASALATDISCFGLGDGSIDLSASNGVGPYTYNWSSSETTEDLSNLGAGTYTCTVTDNVGCSTTASATVTEPTALVVTLPGNYVLNCITTSITVIPTVSGGVSPYLYLWSNGATTANLPAAQPGSYVLTVSDAHSCTATANTVILMDVVAPVACVSPPGTLNCVVSSFQLNGSCSSQGGNFIYQWFTANGNFTGGANTLTPSISEPGTYTLIVTNATNGCTDIQSVQVTEDIVPPFFTAGPDLAQPCSVNGVVTLAAMGESGPLYSLLWAGPGITIGNVNLLNPVVDQPGTYSLTVTNTQNGCTITDDMVVTIIGGGLCGSIHGRVLQDTLANCQSDPGEPAFDGRIVTATSALNTYYGVTDVNGDYQIFVKAGDTYALSANAPSQLWLPCPAIPTVTVANAFDNMTAADLLFKKLADCPQLSVDISSGNLRRCFFTNNFNVQYCNQGTAAAENTYVIVTLDPLFSLINSSIPATDLGAGMLRFEIGHVPFGNCGTFYFNAMLSCDAVIGQTFCTEAHIYPDSSCIPTDPLWTGASLQLSSQCQADSLRFRIENVGTGNMNNAVNYIVIEDQVMLMNAPLQLNAGEYATVSVPANGSTWRMEVPQVPFHPGFSMPAVSVEGCTTGASFTTGFVTIFSADDADVFVDVDCRAVTGSYDPNEKQAFPTGYGAQHYIRPGTSLEYQIQFQNTGNDTAFTVRIIDTISAWLNPSTIRPGASSHPYSWDLSGAGVLSFLCKDILLPDSNNNEVASHGFVKFSISPRVDAPLETLIENTADIYFDFNDPIVTNTTFHRLGENFITVGSWQPEKPHYQVLVTPNPFSDAAILEVKGLPDAGALKLQVFDLQGNIEMEMSSESHQFQLKNSTLTTGMHLFQIKQAGKMVGAGKLVIQH